jgi:hypothetical protein
LGIYTARYDGYALNTGCACESIGEDGAIVPPREDRGGEGVGVKVNVMGDGNNVLGAATMAPSDPPLPMNTTTVARATTHRLRTSHLA